MHREASVLRLSPALMEIPQPYEDFLRFAAKTMLAQPELMKDIGATGFFGTAFVGEAWIVDAASADEMLDLVTAGTSLAQHPRRKAVRVITAVDLFGRIYQIQRIRGEKPADRSDEDTAVRGGTIIRALVDMTLAIARQMPNNEEFLAELEFLFLDDADTLRARIAHNKGQQAGTAVPPDEEDR